MSLLSTEKTSPRMITAPLSAVMPRIGCGSPLIALPISTVSAALDGSGRYVRLEDDSTIYLLPTASLDPLMRVSVNGLEG